MESICEYWTTLECTALDQTGRTKTSPNLKALLSMALYAENLWLSIVQPNGMSVGSFHFTQANWHKTELKLIEIEIMQKHGA